MVEPGTMLIKVIHRIERGGWRKRDHTQRIQYRSLEKPALYQDSEIPARGKREERKGPDGVEVKRLKVEGCCILVF